MIKGSNVIAVIPARGGSKSVPEKNLYPLGGKPLISWTIDIAIKTKIIDRVIVSTDNKKIKQFAENIGCEVYNRPVYLSTDTSLVIDTIKFLYNQILKEGGKVDIIVLLEATSPFRTPELIEKCLNRLVNENLDSIATFNEAIINPERTWKIKEGQPTPFIKGAIPWKPRQKLKKAFQLNGLVYAFLPSKLSNVSQGLLFGKMGAEITSFEKDTSIW